MLLLYTGLAIVLVVLGTGGEVGRLLDVRLHRVRLLFAGVGAHLLASNWRPTGGFGRAVGFLILLASLALVVRFVVANLGLTNMSVVLVGLGLNTLCVVVNGGMPVALPATATEADTAPYEHSLTHHVERDDDHLTVLGDHLRLPGPTDTPISYGDLVLAFGLMGVGYRVGSTERRGAHAARPNAVPMIEVPPDEPLFAEDAPALVRAWPMDVVEAAAIAAAPTVEHEVDMETTTIDLEPIAAFLEGVAAALATSPEPIDLAEATGLGVDLEPVAAFFAAVDEASAHGIAPDHVDLAPAALFFDGVDEAEAALAEVDAADQAEEADRLTVVEGDPQDREPEFDEQEPIEALWIDEADEFDLGFAAPLGAAPIPPLPEVATHVDEPEDDVLIDLTGADGSQPAPVVAAAPERPARPRPPRIRRHRRLPRPVRPVRIDLQHLFAPVPLDPEDLADHWWGEPDPLAPDASDTGELVESVPRWRRSDPTAP